MRLAVVDGAKRGEFLSWAAIKWKETLKDSVRRFRQT